jgi:hypothetical protein
MTIKTIMLANVQTKEMVQYSNDWWLVGYTWRVDLNTTGPGILEAGLTGTDAQIIKIRMWCHDNCTDVFEVTPNKVLFRSVEDATLFTMSTEKCKPVSLLADGTSAGHSGQHAVFRFPTSY